MTHTPGPWGVLRGKEIVVVYTPFRGSEDELSSFISLHNAAPDMLEALEWLSNEFDCRDDEYGMVGFTHDEFRKVEAAIRKARGEG